MPNSEETLQNFIDKKFSDQNDAISELKEELNKLKVVLLTSVKKAGQARVGQEGSVSPLTASALDKHAAASGNKNDAEPRSRLDSYSREDVFFDAIDTLPTGRDPVEQLQTTADELSFNFDASKAVFVCEVSNDVAGEVPIVSSIIGVLRNIFEKVDEASCNKEACEVLGARIFDLAVALKDLLSQEKNVPLIASALRSLRNKLNEASAFIETFSKRGWLSKIFMSGSDSETFKEFEDDLTKIVSDAQFAVMGKMLQLQGQTYDISSEVHENVRQIIDHIGGIESLGKSVKDAKKVADEFGVSVEEIQGESCALASQIISSQSIDTCKISKDIVRHKGFREFWQRMLPSKKSVKVEEFKEAVSDYLTDDLKLDKDLIRDLMDEWTKILKVLDKYGEGIISLSGIRRTFNVIRAKNRQDDDFVSGLRAIIKFADNKRNTRAHHKPNSRKYGRKGKRDVELVGRSAESVVLVQALLSASQSKNYHALEICGGDGLGKTTFCDSVCRLPAVETHFQGGINYVSLEATGSEVQRSATTADEVSTSVLNAMNFDFEQKTDSREALYNLLKSLSSGGRRILLIFDGVDSDSNDEVCTQISQLAGMRGISAILLTSTPLVHPALQVSTRIMLEPLKYRDAARLVHAVNPNLSKKSRNCILALGEGNPSTLVTLAKMPKRTLENLRLSKTREGEYENWPSWLDSSSFTKHSNSSNNNKSGEGAADISKYDSNSLSEVVPLQLARNLTSSSNDSNGSDPRLLEIVLEAAKLGFGTGAIDGVESVQHPSSKSRPTKIGRGVSDPEKGGGERGGEEFNPVVPPLRAKHKSSMGLLSSSQSTNTSSAVATRPSIFGRADAEGGVKRNFLQVVLLSLGANELHVLHLLCLVPSCFNWEFFAFCYNDKDGGDGEVEQSDFDSEMMFEQFQTKGFIEGATADCSRFIVKRCWKRALLRNLVMQPDVLYQAKRKLASYFLSLVMKTNTTWIAHRKNNDSWESEEALLYLKDDIHNVISVLKGDWSASDEDLANVFGECEEILRREMKPDVFDEIKLKVQKIGSGGQDAEGAVAADEEGSVQAVTSE